MENNFIMEYDILKDDFTIRTRENEIGRVAKISAFIAMNECLCNNGDVITLFEDYLPIAYIKREVINQDSETKTVVIEIKDNKYSTKQELDERMKKLAFDAVVALVKEHDEKKEITQWEKIVEIFAEMIDIYKISKNKEKKNVAKKKLQEI